MRTVICGFRLDHHRSPIYIDDDDDLTRYLERGYMEVRLPIYLLPLRVPSALLEIHQEVC